MQGHDRAGSARRHIHGGLVGLERGDRGVHLERVAGGDQQLDDGDIFEATEVGYADIDLGHGAASSVQWTGLIGVDAERGEHAIETGGRQRAFIDQRP